MKISYLTKLIFLSVTVLSTWGHIGAINIEDYSLNDSSMYVTITKDKTVMDTIATQQLIKKYVGDLVIHKENLVKRTDSLKKELIDLNTLIEDCNAYKLEYDSIIKYISYFIQLTSDTKLKDTQQRADLISLFDSIKIEEKENTFCIDKKANKTIYVKPSTLDSISEVLNLKNKDFKSVLKDVSKGKISPTVSVYLAAIAIGYRDMAEQTINESLRFINKSSNINTETQQLEKEIKSLSQTLDQISNTDNYSSQYYILTKSYNYPQKTIKVTESIENKYYRPKGQYNAEIDLLHQTSGWEWALDENNLIRESVYFPNNVTYKYHPDHKEYKIIGPGIFDEKGNLLRVLYYKDASNLFSNLEKEYINDCVISDYKNNKYGILNKSQDVQYALKNTLGLSNEHSKKINQIGNKTVDTFSKSSGKNKRELNKSAQNILGLMMAQEAENKRMKNEEAINFIKQCKKDHEAEFGKLWKVVRVDDKTFNILIYSDTLNTVRNYKVEFSVSEPFGKLNLQYSRLPDTKNE